MNTVKTLHDYSEGDTIRLHTINIDGSLKRRLLDLGFVPGGVITVLQKSPLGDPVAFWVRGTIIALRKEEASKITGEKIGER